MSKSTDKPAKDFYDGLGAHYDIVTRTQRYDKWVTLYTDIFESHGVPGERLLDVGCGTGRSALEMQRRGFQVTGVDLSEEMLAVAREKDGADTVTFLQADVRSLPEIGSHHIATTMSEPLTHLADAHELAAAFEGVARTLVPGGLFVFDLPTPGFNDRLATWNVIDEAEDAVVLWRGAPSGDRAHTTDLTIDVFMAGDNGTWRRLNETVTHHYFPPDQVEKLLSAAGFAVESIYGLYRGELQPGVDLERDRKFLVAARR
ncbi:class I SAM-dependent methyltransferase [Streptomyces sp. NBC_00019]|uniref:class I SAM-dependent DNA methyltransferase n=1 Tax=Streptomyces sp. NBC_00019 TaxID=2975623 RepID=UPI002F90862F